MTTTERTCLSRSLRLALFGLASLLLLSPTFALAAERIAGQVRVKFRAESAQRVGADRFRDAGSASTGLDGFDALARELDVREIRSRRHPVANARLDAQIGISRWYTLTIPGNADVERTLQRLRAHPDVEAAVPVYRNEDFAVPNDTLHPNNWGANNTAQLLNGTSCGGTGTHTCGTAVGTIGFDAGLHQAWNAPQGYGNPNVVIGILDGQGVDVDHPDLTIVPGYDFTNDDADPDADPGSSHGTGCAGIAAAIANNGLGVAGVAGGCSIMPLKANGTANVADAIVYAADHGVDIVSMSFGYPGVSAQKDLEDALQYAYLSGVTMFGATGNENFGQLYLPANHYGVIAVGAASPCGSRKRGSGDPSGTTCDNETWNSNYSTFAVQDASDAVDLLAPTILPSLDIVGEGDTTDGGSADYKWTFNGTSCAAPFAAGVAALLKSRWPDWSPEQIRERMVATATDVVDVEAGVGWDVFTGYGLVNAAAALMGVSTTLVGSPGFPTIQSAIDAASDFDTIRVPAGTYNEAIDFLGKQIVVESIAGPVATIIDATGLDDAVASFRNDETRASILRGFTLTGGIGRLTSLLDRRGGGVHVAAASPTIESCIIDANTADAGGGVYFQESGGALRNCIIGTPGVGNTSGGGAGGVHVLYAHPSGDEVLLEGCTFRDNVAVNNGGALLVQEHAARVVDCDFVGNVAGVRGGAIDSNNNATVRIYSSRFTGNESGDNGGALAYTGAGSCHVWECDFEGNVSTGGNGGAISVGDSVSVFNSRIYANSAQDGGGVRVSSSGILRMVHTTVVGNTAMGTGANRSGGGLYVAGVASVENSIVWGNVASNGDPTELAQVKNNGGSVDLVSTCIEGLTALTGTNLVGNDPAFVDLVGGDLRLTVSSPLRELGTDAAALDLSDVDLDGNVRDWGCAPDLGAYEYVATGTILVPQVVASIQCALDSAVDGETIVVAPGIYGESLSFLGKDVTLESSDGAFATVLDGTGLVDRLVTMNSGESKNTVLRGFTLRNAAPADGEGGAVLVRSGAATIESCVFQSNAETAGGALSIRDAVVDVTNSRFAGNTASGNGGAVRIFGTSVTAESVSSFVDCDFAGNTSGDAGGAIHSDGEGLELRRCVFDGNTAVSGGAVQHDGTGTLLVVRCDFEDNSATNHGGALRFSDSQGAVLGARFFANTANSDATGDTGGGAVSITQAGNVVMAHCTVAGNDCPGAVNANSSGGIFVGGSASLDLIDSILWANSAEAGTTLENQQLNVLGTADVRTTNIHGLSVYAGNGNLNLPPMFVDPAAGDLHLSAGSPLIDQAGNSAVLFQIQFDLDGNPRVDGAAADLGAYEFVTATDVPGTRAPLVSSLHDAAPNPFNPRTSIAYDVARRGPVRLRVFDLRGRLVRTLVDREHDTGRYAVTWDGVDAGGRPAGSGVYLVRMESGDFGATQKVLLVK